MADSVRYTVYLLICVALLLTLRTAFLECRLEELLVSPWLILHRLPRCRRDSFLVSTFKSTIPEKNDKLYDPERIWDKIHPSPNLVWHPCYRNPTVRYQCARLLVPLDYSAPITPSNHASIALIRVRSRGPHRSNKEYKGPVLFNPGGPGGSGVDFILGAGKLFQSILGDNYDIVGFDPRGVSRSRPLVSIFKTPLDRSAYKSRLSAFDLVNTSTDSIPEYIAGTFVANQLAGIAGRDYLEFINTDHTARDMMSIVKSHGRDKLYYWGFSYGSILGATFASLFPDNVGRIVIDGVVDPEDYYSATWSSNLYDTDKVLQSFFTSCHSAGPSHCSFYAPTPEAIYQNLTNIYESIKLNPIPFISTSESGELLQYGVANYNFLRHLIFFSLYQPYLMFPYIADVLTNLAKGNPPPLAPSPAYSHKKAGDEEKLWNRGNDPRYEMGDAVAAIACNDGQRVPGTVKDAVAHYDRMSRMSSWADVWNVRSGCAGWPDLPKYFQGPITANTSYPLLVIGNTADPVTPLAGAKKMSKAFPGSVVLTQDSPGHCSISGPSPCTMMHVRAYFDDGTLPEEGTVCPVLGPPIPGVRLMPAKHEGDAKKETRDGQVVFEGLASDQVILDRELAEAVVELSRSHSLPRLLY